MGTSGNHQSLVLFGNCCPEVLDPPQTANKETPRKLQVASAASFIPHLLPKSSGINEMQKLSATHSFGRFLQLPGPHRDSYHLGQWIP